MRHRSEAGVKRLFLPGFGYTVPSGALLGFIASKSVPFTQGPFAIAKINLTSVSVK